MTSEIQQNRYDRLVRRVAGIIGPGSKVSEVLTELFPMIDVENNRGELQLLAGITIGMGASQITGAAGERPRVQLFNPFGSGIIITVTDIEIATTETQTMKVGRATIELTQGVGTELPRDTRRALTQRMTGRISNQSIVANADANINFRVNADVGRTLHVQNGVMVLAPGNGCTVGASITASTIAITFFWRERTAETSELNF